MVRLRTPVHLELSPELWHDLVSAQRYLGLWSDGRFLRDVATDSDRPDPLRAQPALVLGDWLLPPMLSFLEINYGAHDPAPLTPLQRLLLDLPR